MFCGHYSDESNQQTDNPKAASFFVGFSIVMQCEKLITSRVCVGSWKQSPVNRFAEERSLIPLR
jgi:hypothetical protein